MVTAAQATKNSLVYDLHWEIDTMISCCGADVLIRLGAEYISPSEFDELSRKSIRAIETRGYDFVDHITSWCCDESTAIPLDIAFGVVLQDLLEHSQPHLFFASDSLRRRGDVHVGPFSTKNFLNWLWDNNLAQMGEIKAGHLVGYTFKLDVAVANKAAKKYNNQFKRLRKKQLKEHPDWEDTELRWRQYDW